MISNLQIVVISVFSVVSNLDIVVFRIGVTIMVSNLCIAVVVSIGAIIVVDNLCIVAVKYW